VEQLNNQSTVFFMMWRDGSWFGAFTADCRWLSLSSAVLVGQIAWGGGQLICWSVAHREGPVIRTAGFHSIDRSASCWLKKKCGSTRRSGSSLIDDFWSNQRRLYWSLADCCGANNHHYLNNQPVELAPPWLFRSLVWRGSVLLSSCMRTLREERCRRIVVMLVGFLFNFVSCREGRKSGLIDPSCIAVWLR
jgi:hypothetical protein